MTNLRTVIAVFLDRSFPFSHLSPQAPRSRQFAQDRSQVAALVSPAGFTCQEGEIKSRLRSEALLSARIGWKPGGLVESGEESNSTGCQAGAGGELHLHCTRLIRFQSKVCRGSKRSRKSDSLKVPAHSLPARLPGHWAHTDGSVLLCSSEQIQEGARA